MRALMTRTIAILMVLTLAVAFGSYWAWMGRSHVLPDLQQFSQGMAYTPYQAGQEPGKTVEPNDQQMLADLQRMKDLGVQRVRTYSAQDAHARIPLLAQQLNMQVTLGVWLGSDLQRNAQEMQAGIALAQRFPNITRILVGNESLLRGETTVEQLQRAMKDMRAQTGRPVSTAEPWTMWIAHPELADVADSVVIHILPFWEKIPNDQVEHFSLNAVRQTQSAFPHKPVVVGEIGWPSGGRASAFSEPSLVTQALFVRKILPALQRAGVEAFLMEAVDQPWKYTIEGSVGAFWGYWNADREAKFPLTGPVSNFPAWSVYALGSMALMMALGLWILRLPLSTKGHLVGCVGGAGAVWLSSEVAKALHQQYWSHGGQIGWAFSLMGLICLSLVAWADLREMMQAAGRSLHRAKSYPFDAEFLPPVSLHMACHAEPPEVVCATLDSLANLQYPDFEVLVLDNNTKDKALWQPLQEHCAFLNARLGKTVFRFFHDEGVKGFKAGALNLGLERTRSDAFAIGVVDADYWVSPTWLLECMPYFKNETLALMQSPQDHRDGEADASAFKQGMRWEYEGFFKVGMCLRNEDDAIVQHGTMCLVRTKAMKRVGGWSVDQICEDTELGLRLQAQGWETFYAPKSQGKGLMPDAYPAYATQRHRWAYGGMRILAKHWRLLLPSSPLRPAQKLAYIAGWLPWMGEAIGVLASLFALLWTIAALSVPEYIQVPPAILSAPIFVFLVWKVSSIYLLQRYKVGASSKNALLSVIAGMSLMPAVGAAVLHAMIAPNLPFARTPKAAPHMPLWQALHLVRKPMMLALSLSTCAVLSWLYLYPADWAGGPWALALLAFAMPFWAATLMAILGSRQGTKPSYAALAIVRTPAITGGGLWRRPSIPQSKP